MIGWRGEVGEGGGVITTDTRQNSRPFTGDVRSVTQTVRFPRNACLRADDVRTAKGEKSLSHTALLPGDEVGHRNFPC